MENMKVIKTDIVVSRGAACRQLRPTCDREGKVQTEID